MGLFSDIDNFFDDLFGLGGIKQHCSFCDRETTWKFAGKISKGCDEGSTDYWYRYRCTTCGDESDEPHQLYNHN